MSLDLLRARRFWIGATALLLAVAFWAPFPMRAGEPQERRITLVAHSFAFDPGTIRVNKGDTVIVRLESEDVVHGLFIDGYGVKSENAEPGRPAEFSFVADRAGAFRMRCAVACGTMHPFMIGKLVVGGNPTWLRAILATLITAGGAWLIFRPAAIR